jgi:hypothetical protein
LRSPALPFDNPGMARPGCAPWLSLLAVLSLAAAARGQEPAPSLLLRSLSDPSLKVRLKAVAQAGKHKVAQAAPRLRQILAAQNEPDALRAASALALGQLGDQEARELLGPLVGHKSKLIATHAEKSLVLLDRALPAPPVVMVEIEPPALPPRSSPALGQRILETLKARVRQARGAVLGCGEHRVLSDEELKSHLERRGVTVGYLLKPVLEEFRVTPDGGRTTFFARVGISGRTILERRLAFQVGGEGDAWIDGTGLTKAEKKELTDEALDRATDSALMQAFAQIQSQ